MNHLGASRITLPASRHVRTHVVEDCLTTKYTTTPKNKKRCCIFSHMQRNDKIWKLTSAIALSAKFLSQTKRTLLLYGATISCRWNWDDLDQKLFPKTFRTQPILIMIMRIIALINQNPDWWSLGNNFPPAPHDDAGEAFTQLTACCALSPADAAQMGKMCAQICTDIWINMHKCTYLYIYIIVYHNRIYQTAQIGGEKLLGPDMTKMLEIGHKYKLKHVHKYVYICCRK